MDDFNNKAEYMAAVAKWKADYAALSAEIIKRRNNGGSLSWLREQATDMLRERARAKIKAQQLYVAARREKVRLGIEEGFARYPLVMENCSSVDFYFNKAHLQYSDVIPRWIIRTKGETFYVHHIDSQIGWSSRELDSGSTLGMIRLRKCRVEIDATGHCTISEAMALAA